MGTRDKILARAKRGELRATKLSRELNLSRQTVTTHLRRLVAEGKLVRSGSTRGAVYGTPRKLTHPSPPLPSLLLVKQTRGLAEDRVFKEVDGKLAISKRVNEKVHSIIAYAFTEMLNNAIEHAHGPRVQVRVWFTLENIEFEVRDYGIGIFKNVMNKFRLKDEFSGLEHVLKGKQTTAPKAHSGEGIFFTSRVADRLVLRSHGLNVTIDNKLHDTFVSERRFLVGTLVLFSILRRSKKDLGELFSEYSDEDYAFDRNKVRVKISGHTGALSRSQARRLLFGLEKYRTIILDFAGVKEIGQGFADEVFRVYASSHKEMVMDYENANRAVEFLILRARRHRTS